MDDTVFQLNTINALSRLLGSLTSVSTVYEYGGLAGIATSLEANISNAEVALASVQLSEKIANVPDAPTYMSDGLNVNAVLEAMLVQDEDETLIRSGIATLELVATAEDCSRHLGELTMAVQAARNDPERVFKTLAAVGGLSRVTRLRNIFEEKKAAKLVLKNIGDIIEGTKFEGQDKVVRAGIKSAKTLKLNSSGDIADFFVAMGAVGCLPQLKRMAELEAVDDNVLTDVTNSLHEFAATGRIANVESIEHCIEATLKVMRKYPDSRRAQISCLQTLNCLAAACNGEGVQGLIKTGALTAVVSYLNRAPMYLDAQIAGFTTLATCVKLDTNSVEVLRKNNAMQAVNTATRTHSKSKELRRVIAPLVAVLMPEEFLEREIREKLDNITNSIATMRPGDFHDNLSSLNDLLMTVEGSKIAAKNNAAAVTAKAVAFIAANQAAMKAFRGSEGEPSGEEFLSSCLSETAQVINQVGTTRVGRVALTKQHDVLPLIEIYKMLHHQAPSMAAEEGVARTLEALCVLTKHDKENADLAFDHGCVGLLCKGLEKYPNSEAVLAGTCGCLAAMATTPARVQQLIAQPDFDSLLQKLMAIIETSPSRDIRYRAIQALEDLLLTNDESMANKVAECGGVHALFKVIEERPDDANMVTEAAKALALIGNFEDLRRFWDGDIRKPVDVCSTALRQNRPHAETCQHLLDVMNKMTVREDSTTLQEAGCMEIVADIMATYPEDEEIVRIGGELFAKMGADQQIKSLMLQIIAAVEGQAEGFIQKVDGLCVSLAMFLAAPIDDTADALQHTEPCLQSLSSCLGAAPSDGRLMGNVAMVTRRLCDRCFDDSEDAYGAWAFASSQQLYTFSGMIEDPNHKAGTSKKFLTSAYRSLAATCVNLYSRPTMLSIGGSSNLLPRSYELLVQHQSDPEVVARILEFLRYYADDEAGAADVLSLQGDLGDIVETTLALMSIHNRSDSIFIAGTGLLGTLALNGGRDCHPNFTDGRVLRDCEGMMAGTTASAAKQLAMMELVEKLLSSTYYADAVKNEKAIDKLIGRLRQEEDERHMTDEERASLFMGLARVLACAGEAGMVAEIERTRGLNALLRALDDVPDDPEVVKSVTRALAAMAGADVNMAARITHDAIPKLALDCSAIIQTDPECADGFCDLMEILLMNEDAGHSLKDILGVDETLQGIEQLADYYGEEFGAALKEKVARIRRGMVDERSHEATCKGVYDLLLNRKTQQLSNSVQESPLLLEKFDFLITQMGMYGQEKLDSKSSMGKDHQFGNMAFQLLCEDESNEQLFLEKDFVNLCLASIKGQEEEIATYSTMALNDFCKGKGGAQGTVKTKGCTTVTTESLGRLQKSKKFDNTAREEHLLPRVQLIERTAVNRNIYNKTMVMSALIALWDDFDDGLYTTVLLRHVFRSMRRVVSDAHLDTLLKANVLSRLKDIIDRRPPDVGLLPDVLFLYGSMGVVPEIKTKIGELGGIQSCVSLLGACMSDPLATAAMTNCCLALANICIAHKKNISIFAKLKGQDLNVEVLNQRGNEYDIANAASVLLCNMLYKNEDMKKLYGVNGAPAALVYALRQYDGSNEKSVIRCLQSLFKAISNLSLFTPNVHEFLSANIEEAYKVLLENAGVNFPDHIMETALRTLSNLTMENEEIYMKKFGIVLVPLMGIGKQGRTDTQVLLLLLDIECSLCRFGGNAQLFSENGGIETTTKIIHQFDYDVSVLTAGIHLLGIQSTIPGSIDLLMEADVFSILIGCCEVDAEGNEVTDLVVGGLRCARRIVDSEDLALEYCNVGGILCLRNLICNSVNFPMIALEAYRLLLCLISATDKPPPAAAEEEDEPDELEEEEESVNVNAGWVKMGMDESMVSAILQAVCTTLLMEGHHKQQRLQRTGMGICAYFASQKVSTESMIQSNFSEVMQNCLTNFIGDNKLTLSSCIAINNVAKTSGDLYEAIQSKELISAVKAAITKIPTKDPASKQIRVQCTATLTALNKSEDPFLAFEDTRLDYDLALSEFDIDPYPNGVQDLPSDIKQNLRKGAKYTICLPGNEKEDIVWRASQDLHALEWQTGKEKDFPNRVPMVRLRSFTKGLTNDILKEANKKEPRKVTALLCMSVYGPASEDYPNGLCLPIKTKTKKDRDQFVDWLVMWRDAATYSY
eukprot:GHVS01040084.1.p1 GENE.GHVS01040084.1~~GHVS01040084.1.p1  ORF type:complete len:2151 (+),score=222.55 GHVS01040084.1:985-7437(+)